MNRNRLIVGSLGLGVIILLGILAVVGFVRFLGNRQTGSARSHLVPLGYCNADGVKPCIVSFSVDDTNHMLVNVLIPANYAEFYLIISNANAEYKYECQKLQDFPNNVTCTGPQMYPGPQLHFELLSTLTGQTFARGDFAIIGLMLPSPVAAVTETATELAAATEAPTEFLTGIAGTFETPTAITLELATKTPTARPTASSYPNPSYYP